jgi:hypothetical protein
MLGKSDAAARRGLALTDGEINFLWSFIQGSIMIPETWNALLAAHGFCERHAWAHISVEMSFRERHFLGPIILYRALIERAVQALRAHHASTALAARVLRGAGPCFLCALNIDAAAAGASPRERLARGRDSSKLLTFAVESWPFWRNIACAVCAADPGAITKPCRCRRHFLMDFKEGRPVDLSWQRETLQRLSEELVRYEKSSVASADEPSDRDRAALISGVGWSSGWRPLLALLNDIR